MKVNPDPFMFIPERFLRKGELDWTRQILSLQYLVLACKYFLEGTLDFFGLPPSRSLRHSTPFGEDGKIIDPSREYIISYSVCLFDQLNVMSGSSDSRSHPLVFDLALRKWRIWRDRWRVIWCEVGNYGAWPASRVCYHRR
jgi:hypothetical protein